MLSPRLDAVALSALSTLALAQVGDAAFELMVRTRLCAAGTRTAQRLHARRVRLVAAPAQAAMAARLETALSGEERAVFTRGRNARAAQVPQAATRREYQAATALETLWGWLWLSGQTERLEELFDLAMEGGRGCEALARGAPALD
ncbi:MAG: ribonuclease III [Oscillospiraceae bacterium]|nr:ribonuclease III [Oscillospiraceae bacterium]